MLHAKDFSPAFFATREKFKIAKEKGWYNSKCSKTCHALSLQEIPGCQTTGERCQEVPSAHSHIRKNKNKKTTAVGHSPHPQIQSDRLPWRWAVHWRPRRKKHQGRDRWWPGRVTQCSRPQWSLCPLAPGWFWLDLPRKNKNVRASHF